MELIYYREAAELLGITPGSLRHAVSGTRKALTVLHQGQKCQVIKEQVLLFKGKHLSLSSLSSQDRVKWQEYENEALNPRTKREDIRAIVHQELNQELAPLLSEISTLNTEEEAARQRLAAIQGQKEGFRKALSILRARADTLALVK